MTPEETHRLIWTALALYRVTGLKHTTEAVTFTFSPPTAFVAAGQVRGWVGERRVPEEAAG